MQEGNSVVFGVFDERPVLDRAVDALKLAGFRNSDISVLMSDSSSTQEFAQEKRTKAPEGTTAGATAGVAVGGALGWLTGIGALAIPGIGPFIAAGPIMAALAGAGLGGVVGGISGALIGMGIPEYEAKRYEDFVKTGGILLSVHCDNAEWTSQAENVLNQNGARDVSSAGEAYQKDRVA